MAYEGYGPSSKKIKLDGASARFSTPSSGRETLSGASTSGNSRFSAPLSSLEATSSNTTRFSTSIFSRELEAISLERPEYGQSHSSGGGRGGEMVEGVRRTANTIKSTSWAIKTFHDWKRARNAKCTSTEDYIAEDVLEQFTFDGEPAPLVHALSLFVMEARNKDGNPYTPSSIHGMLCGIKRYMTDREPSCPSFMDKSKPQYKELHRVIDITFADLRKQGIGGIRPVQIITPREEDILWEKGLMGVDSPLQLQRAVFYYVGKLFCISGGRGQKRSLRLSQFRRGWNPDKYTYVCGTNKGDYLDKEVSIISSPQAGNRCLVHLLDLYMSKLPRYAFEKDNFYIRPKAEAPRDVDSPWYEAIPVGKEKLRTMIRDMCASAGLGLKSNHSLRATYASQKYSFSMPASHLSEYRQPAFPEAQASCARGHMILVCYVSCVE